MEREQLFRELSNISDPSRDYNKILGNLHFTHYHLMDFYKKVLQPYGLTSPQANVLSIIVYFHPKTVSLEEIKHLVLEPNSDVSRTVVRLEEKGYVKKHVDKTNRRKRAIRVTGAGLKAFKKVESDKKFKNLMASLTLERARIFVETLQSLRTAK